MLYRVIRGKQFKLLHIFFSGLFLYLFVEVYHEVVRIHKLENMVNTNIMIRLTRWFDYALNRLLDSLRLG